MEHDWDEPEVPDLTARAKLPFLKSPLVDPAEDIHEKTPSLHDGGLPVAYKRTDTTLSKNGGLRFERHAEPSTLEVFFDLCFAANYGVFAANQGVNSHARFKAYVGYFSLLWLTWFTVSAYDVRYLTDSILERMARAMHLGVMVGFAVVAPKFNPTNQDVPTMKTMSVILAVSRYVLAFEYAGILWHVRKFKRAHLPFIIQVVINFVAASIYLGITFRFHKDYSRVFVAWYIIGGLEGLLTIVLSNVWTPLSFTRTHLMTRISLLTVIFLGDGILLIANNVVLIVKSADAWNGVTIGLVTAATAGVYFVFLVYFDWMKRSYLPPLRQQLWAALHLPFHLCLILFFNGFTGLIIWSKVADVLENVNTMTILDNLASLAKATTADVAKNLTAMTEDFFALYKPEYTSTSWAVDIAIDNITDISDKFWPVFADAMAKNTTDQLTGDALFDYASLLEALVAIVASMENALFQSFKIDLFEELSEKHKDKTNMIDYGGFESYVTEKTWKRFSLVFSYAYLAAGLTLILMTILLIVSRVTSWKPWPIVRCCIYMILGLGTGVVSTLYYNVDAADNLLYSGWAIAPITFVWGIVLILTHIGGTSPAGRVSLFKRAFPFLKKGPQPYAPVNPQMNAFGDEQVKETSTTYEREVTGLTPPLYSTAVLGDSHVFNHHGYAAQAYSSPNIDPSPTGSPFQPVNQFQQPVAHYGASDYSSTQYHGAGTQGPHGQP